MEPDKKIPPYYLVRLGQLHENFQAEAAKFSQIMSNAGIFSMEISDTLRKLNFLYMQIAAGVDAARTMDKKASLESGIQALEYIRELEAAQHAIDQAAAASNPPQEDTSCDDDDEELEAN